MFEKWFWWSPFCHKEPCFELFLQLPGIRRFVFGWWDWLYWMKESSKLVSNIRLKRNTYCTTWDIWNLCRRMDCSSCLFIIGFLSHDQYELNYHKYSTVFLYNSRPHNCWFGSSFCRARRAIASYAKIVFYLGSLNSYLEDLGTCLHFTSFSLDGADCKKTTKVCSSEWSSSGSPGEKFVWLELLWLFSPPKIIETPSNQFWLFRHFIYQSSYIDFRQFWGKTTMAEKFWKLESDVNWLNTKLRL